MMEWWIIGTIVAIAVFGFVGVFATRGEAWFALGLVLGGVLDKISKFNDYCKRMYLKLYWWGYDRRQEFNWWYGDVKRKMKS